MLDNIFKCKSVNKLFYTSKELKNNYPSNNKQYVESPQDSTAKLQLTGQ